MRRHRFLAGLGPFEHRPSAPGSGTPTSPDCARVTPRGLRLGVRPGPWRCAAVHAPSWAFVEGRLEVRARFPGPAGFHSAAWLQSPTPYASAEDHEVDAAEHFGAGRVHHSVWAGPRWDDPERLFHAATEVDPAAWHVYGVDRRDGLTTFSVDGREVARAEGLPASRPVVPVLSALVSPWERAPEGWPAPARPRDMRALFAWAGVSP